MISAIIHATIVGKPEQLNTKHGKPYARAKLRTIHENMGDFVSAVCFDENLYQTLLALNDGDSVALSGKLTAKAYVDKTVTPRVSFDMVVYSIMTPYQALDRMNLLFSIDEYNLSNDRPTNP